MHLEKFASRKIAIVGLGIEGLSTAKYFLSHNIQFSIFDEKSLDDLCHVSPEWEKVLQTFQEKEIPLFLGKQLSAEVLQKFDVIVRSPGISLKADFFKNFRGDMMSHTKLFFDICPAKIIGVTGTKGKGTTSSLIYEMLKKAGQDAYLGGNIGLPPLSFVDSLTANSVVVLELSSFQLQDIEKSPHIAVMLMVTQEHLDSFGNQNYHASIEEYREAKRNIFAFQHADDMAVLNTDYEGTRQSAGKTSAKLAWVSRYQEVENGCFIRDNEVILRMDGFEEKVIDIPNILLPGAHNLENICAAVMVAHFANVPLFDMVFVLRTFKGLEHRLELVREVGGIRYYDDSFSTVPETAIAAIQAFDSPEILILGGSKKGSNFAGLGKVIRESPNIKAIIGIGIEWPTMKASIGDMSSDIAVIENLHTMEEIVAKAHSLADSGDVVILSPACASFDMFANYKDRGNQFKKQVNLL